MTKYCPACESEFQDALVLCPDDGENLRNTPAAPTDRNLSVDLYSAANEIEGQCIVELLLDAGIAAQLFRNQVPAMPNLGDEHFVISVNSADKKNASDAIRSAQADGAISKEGLFL